jgi:hypothetical protein
VLESFGWKQNPARGSPGLLLSPYWFHYGTLIGFTTEHVAVPTVRSYTDGKISGPSAQDPFRLGKPSAQENRRHRKVCADGNRRHSFGRRYSLFAVTAR